MPDLTPSEPEPIDLRQILGQLLEKYLNLLHKYFTLQQALGGHFSSVREPILLLLLLLLSILSPLLLTNSLPTYPYPHEVCVYIPLLKYNTGLPLPRHSQFLQSVFVAVPLRTGFLRWENARFESRVGIISRLSLLYSA